jgi:hypothetical protein
MAYCEWFNETFQSELGGLLLRLPREAEWEKAARGAYGNEWPWGNEFDPNKCNSVEGGKGGTTPVGSYSSAGGDSPYGCADMVGNVWEWTEVELTDGWHRWTLLRGGSHYKARGSVWYAEGGEAQVEITHCGNTLCGRVVWLRSPLEENGCILQDHHNPDTTMRNRRVLGLEILQGLTPNSGNARTTPNRNCRAIAVPPLFRTSSQVLRSAAVLPGAAPAPGARLDPRSWRHAWRPLATSLPASQKGAT